METLDLKEQPDGFTIRIRVIPKAHRNALAGVENGALLVRLVAPPVEGKANQALLEYLRSRLGLRKHQLHLLGGQKSRHKLVKVQGVERAALERLAGPESEE